MKQAHQFSKGYQVSLERSEWIVSVRKTGVILAYFQHKHQAEEYIAEQGKADEQHAVMGAYNEEQEIRCLAAEFLQEL